MVRALFGDSFLKHFHDDAEVVVDSGVLHLINSVNDTNLVVGFG